jgi:hypothetical protein
MNQPDKSKNNYDRLWKIKFLFDMLTGTCTKFDSTSENLTISRHFGAQRRVIFNQHIPKKHKYFVIKDIQIVQRDWLHLQHEHILGKGQAKYKRQ